MQHTQGVERKACGGPCWGNCVLVMVVMVVMVMMAMVVMMVMMVMTVMATVVTVVVVLVFVMVVATMTWWCDAVITLVSKSTPNQH